MQETKQYGDTTSIELIATNLSGQRGHKILFQNLSFTLKAGKILLLKGGNGTGKSTLMRIIANLYSPLNGDVGLVEYMRDNRTSPLDLPLNIFSHYLNDKNAMKPQLSVWQNLRFWYYFLTQDKKQAKACEQHVISSALQQVKMEAYQELAFASLSTGQKRRIALARLLLAPRILWLLDEPVSGLDQESNLLFTKLCQDHLAKGGMIIVATHVFLNIPADRTIIMQDYQPETKAQQYHNPLATEAMLELAVKEQPLGKK